MPEALRRAQEDLAAGRPWKARERLRSFVNAFPTDDKALELLGEVHYTMGDLPAAGAVWILCERDDERTRDAIEALRDEPALLRVRAPMESWPPVVRERLRAFGVEPETEVEPPSYGASSTADSLALVGCVVGVIAIAVFAVIGVVMTVVWLVG